jgi:hypothetical protein
MSKECSNCILALEKIVSTFHSGTCDEEQKKRMEDIVIRATLFANSPPLLGRRMNWKKR